MPFSQIVTHPGGCHKDEFLACSLLLAENHVTIFRREPGPIDLEDPATAVVDVGGEHDALRGNFDHHQFPRDHPPACALSLVLQSMGLYRDALQFCDWLHTTEILDTRGPNFTATQLGISRETLACLNSPIDITLLRRFASLTKLEPGQPLWEVMRWIGLDLIEYIKTLRERLDFIEKTAVTWTIATPTSSFKALYMPRTEPLPEEPSAGLGKFISLLPHGHGIAAMVYPDRRGSGFGLSRHDDHPSLDFVRISNEADVHFAHARGFIAKTSATDPARLQQLLASAWGL